MFLFTGTGYWWFWSEEVQWNLTDSVLNIQNDDSRVHKIALKMAFWNQSCRLSNHGLKTFQD